MSKVKARLMGGAMKFMQSETGQKVMSSQEFQKAMMLAFQTTYKVKGNLQKAKLVVAGQFDLVSGGDFRNLKREVDKLRRQVDDLKS